MAIPDAIRQWFQSLDTDTPADPTETPEPVGEGEDPTTESDSDLNPDATDQTNDGVQDDAPADENTDTTGGDRTAPEPETALTDDERDAMNTLAGENEALRQENADLRNRIAELGGDAALGIVEEQVEDLAGIDPDDTDEYDPDADIADQETELRRLRGE